MSTSGLSPQHVPTHEDLLPVPQLMHAVMPVRDLLGEQERRGNELAARYIREALRRFTIGLVRANEEMARLGADSGVVDIDTGGMSGIVG